MAFYIKSFLAIDRYGIRLHPGQPKYAKMAYMRRTLGPRKKKELEERKQQVIDRLKEYRNASGLMQDEVAQHLGFSGQYQVSKIEKGEVDPTIFELEDLCRLYGKSLNDLSTISKGRNELRVKVRVRELSRATKLLRRGWKIVPSPSGGFELLGPQGQTRPVSQRIAKSLYKP